MSRHPDDELDDLVERMPALQPLFNLLRLTRLKPPPLDPNFRLALRRRLLQTAYERYETQRRPSFLARLFGGPGMAVGLAAAAVLLLGLVLVANGGNWFGPGQVQVTTVGAVSVNQPITVSFNQPMDHLSVEKAIQIEPATQVTYTWHGNNLVIQPASGELAPNTQYHVTVAAGAKTAPGVKIGQAAVVAVNTTPLPTPSPTPNPSPSPPAPPQITGERSVPSTSGAVVGWSADGHSLFFLSASGNLDLISSDGAVLKTIATGVRLASVMPGSSTVAYATAGSGSKLYTTSGDASGIQLVDTRSVDAIGWLAGKPVVQVQGEIGPAGTTTKLPAADAQCVFAPDGNRLLCATIPSTGQASPKPIIAFLFDVAAQKATNWPAAGQGFAWRPDGSKVAYWSAGSVFVAAPDGTGPIEVGKSPQPSDQSWSPDGLSLLFANQSGASIVKAGGSALHQLSQATFQDPVWSPSGGQFAFARGSSLWIDDVTVGGTALDLGVAGSVVDQYEQARIKNDAVTASGLLAPSASPTTPSSVAGDARLVRYFVISSQATATEVRCTVRLIFAKGSDEVRYQDEQLVIVPAGADLKIGSITDSPPLDLGKGPTVNSVQLLNGFVVVVFDSDLDPATVAGGTVLTGADGKPVALTTSYVSRRLTVTAKLNGGAKYHLSLSSSIKDIAGQSLQGGYDYDFVALAPAPTP